MGIGGGEEEKERVGRGGTHRRILCRGHQCNLVGTGTSSCPHCPGSQRWHHTGCWGTRLHLPGTRERVSMGYQGSEGSKYSQSLQYGTNLLIPSLCPHPHYLGKPSPPNSPAHEPVRFMSNLATTHHMRLVHSFLVNWPTIQPYWGKGAWLICQTIMNGHYHS